MTLDEAIKHCEEVIEELEKEAQEWHENQVRKCKLIPFAEMDYTHENECKECARDHKQLAEWLKELKQFKEQEPCEDCISRAEAIKGLGEQPLVWTDSNSEIQQLLDWREHKEMLEKLPSVGQKVGHWIVVDDCGDNLICECSECKDEVWFKDASRMWNYCSSCGARMKGE